MTPGKGETRRCEVASSQMPRFFFNSEDGEFVADVLGTELPDLEAARAGAIAMAGELLRDTPQQVAADGRLAVTVTDEWGLTVFTVEVRVGDRMGGRPKVGAKQA